MAYINNSRSYIEKFYFYQNTKIIVICKDEFVSRLLQKFLCPKAIFVCQTGTPFVVCVNFIANKCQRKCRKSCDVVAKVSLEKITFEKDISNLA